MCALTSLRFVFVYGRPGVLDPRLGEDRARGGIVTALLALAGALVDAGHEVEVVARCPVPGVYRGVRFIDRAEMVAWLMEAPADVLVCVPELLALVLPVPARARLVWSGNAFAGGDVLLSAGHDWAPELGRSGRVARVLPLSAVPAVVDGFVAKSLWQAKRQQEATGISGQCFHVVGNGVPLEHYNPQGRVRHPSRVVYSSQPRRGLEHLLAIWPVIRSRVPSAELHLFGYEGVGDAATDPVGVLRRGALSKSALAGELLQATAFAYPNTTRETFCTAVAEAQAAGLPVVTSARAALAERVDHGIDGFLVHGDPAAESTRAQFVSHIVSLLRDDELRSRMGRAAARRAWVEYDWARIAARWGALGARLSAGRAVTFPRVGVADLGPIRDSVLRDRGRVGAVPAATVREWLRAAVAEYGVSSVTQDDSL